MQPLKILPPPAAGALIVLGSHSLGIWRALDNVYAFLLLIQHAVPTANQMQNIASMHCNHESALGTLIFWQYAAAFAALPIWCAASHCRAALLNPVLGWVDPEGRRRAPAVNERMHALRCSACAG